MIKRKIWVRGIALLLVVALTGCGNSVVAPKETTTHAPIEVTPEVSVQTPIATDPETDSSKAPNSSSEPIVTPTPAHEHNYVAQTTIQATCSIEGYTVYKCECGDTYNGDYTEVLEHTYEETVIAPTTEAEGYTLFICSMCSYSIKDNYTEKLAEEVLDDAQKNSIAMLNYLATLAQKINASKNSRVFLEEAYASLINNTNPENVNELTESHLCSLLDTIEEFRLIAVKRERLEYLYNQNKAVAIREAIPSPVSVLSAAASLDLKRLVASLAYVAIDSVSSYNAYKDELDQTFLQEGWALDDEAALAMHESRKYAFQYMLQIVREEELPGKLALSESDVESFVAWTNKDNVYSRYQFLLSEEDTYYAFGSYWLELAECCYELKKYEDCLSAITMYEQNQANIFRKDYYLAQIMPLAIAAAAEVYSSDEYISHAEKYLEILIHNTDLKTSEDNTESGDWALRYFAAQIYADFYARTNDPKYLDKAYDLTLNNVNFLVEKQKGLNETYLNEVKEISVPEGATKDEKVQIKDYNKSLKDKRETELPTIYEPLILNCELLYALLEEMDLSSEDKNMIDRILDINGTSVFLTVPLANRYLSKAKNINVDSIFNKTELTIPVFAVSSNSIIKVTVKEGGRTTVYDDWTIKTVERPEEGFDAFTATFVSEKAKDQEWSANSSITVEIFDETGSKYDPLVLRFKVSEYKKFAVFETVKFEQVK